MTNDDISSEVATRYAESIRLIEKAFSGGANCYDAVQILTEACEGGRAYKWHNEPNMLQEDNDARKGAKTAASAARTLSRYLEKYPQQLTPALRSAFLNADCRLIQTEMLNAQVTDQNEQFRIYADPKILERLLKTLADELIETGPTRQRGDVWYPMRFGPLIYNGTIKSRRIPNRHTAHLLFLVFLLRKLDEGWSGWDTGEKMPRAGRPHYPIAAMMVKETFDIDDPPDNLFDSAKAAELVKSRLKSNPGLGFIGYD